MELDGSAGDFGAVGEIDGLGVVEPGLSVAGDAPGYQPGDVAGGIEVVGSSGGAGGEDVAVDAVAGEGGDLIDGDVAEPFDEAGGAGGGVAVLVPEVGDEQFIGVGVVLGSGGDAEPDGGGFAANGGEHDRLIRAVVGND